MAKMPNTDAWWLWQNSGKVLITSYYYISQSCIQLLCTSDFIMITTDCPVLQPLLPLYEQLHSLYDFELLVTYIHMTTRTTLQVYEIRNSPAATAADVKFIMDISFKVQLIAELAFHYLAFAPDFGATGCFYATYNMKSATNNLTVSNITNFL
jgi:hypothetical protein